ncbi:SIALI-17 repeat-containing surface protein [Streptococcus oralis]|nr:cell wall surface anchor family protein [Streptococcus oralis subsp. tigurinus AZ_3a]
MDKKKVILTSLASAAVLGASVLVSQPSVVKADEGKVEEQAVAPVQPQAGTEGESVAHTEKGSENASPANSDTTNPAKMTKEELMKALDELEEQAISDIEDKEAIEDKEDAAEAVKEYIGKMYISDTLESGELSLDNIIAELPEGAEDKAVVTGPEVQTNKKLSTEEKALLDQAEKDAKEQVSQATDALVQALESLENAVIEDIKKDASITDKEAAIKEAKEEIGKEDLLKAIADEDLEIGDVIVDWPADTSEHKTVAEPVSEFTDEDQAKLDEADKEAQVDAAKVRSDLIATLEKIEKETIDDINKDATITDKEAAIKAAKEVIGKDGILKAIEDGDIEASDLLDDFLAEDSDQVTPAEALSQEDFSSQDQAKLAAADKEAAEENSNAKKLELSKLEEQVAKIKVQLSSLQVSDDKNSQVKDLQQALADYEDAIKTLSSVMSAVLEIEDFKGGVNAVEAATAELPEYNKGVNAVEAAVNELPAYAESGAPVVANVPAYGESGAPIVNNALPYAESGAPVVANVPAYGESGTPIVNNTLPYAESGAPAVANVPVYGESGTPVVNNALPYAESGAPAVATIPAYAEKIEPAVNEVPEYTGSVAPLATNPTLGTEQDRTYKAPAATDEQLLPNTGSKDASAVASLGFVGLLLGLLPFAKRKLNK